MATLSIHDVLFTRTQHKLLGLLYGQPDRTFYTNELVRLAGVGVGSVKRELDRMLQAGMIRVKQIGNQRHYQADPACVIYQPLMDIVRKTSLASAATLNDAGDDDAMLLADALPVSRKALQQIIARYHIKRLSLFGSRARGDYRPDSDIDLMVEFEPGAAPSLWAEAQVRADFSALFGGTPVDIASPEILRNPWRRKSIEPDLKVLYEAA